MIPLALTAASTAISASSTIAGGKAAQAAGIAGQQGKEFEAKQDEQAAQQSRAAAQRKAMEQRHHGVLLKSKLQARAAMSGGGADDPTTVNLAEDIGERSEVMALMDMFTGENRARGYEDRAMANRMAGASLRAEGDMKYKAAKTSALGTIIGGAGSMYSQFSGGPKTATASAGKPLSLDPLDYG